MGRGELQSYCYLHPSPNITSNGKKRLKTIVSSCNGFEIAEIDLNMRGGGFISGLEQSGFLDFRIGDVKGDYSVLIEAKKDAEQIMKNKYLQNNFISDFLLSVQRKIETISFS